MKARDNDIFQFVLLPCILVSFLRFCFAMVGINHRTYEGKEGGEGREGREGRGKSNVWTSFT